MGIFSNPKRRLESFLKNETRNPYVANILMSIKRNTNSYVLVEEAMERVRGSVDYNGIVRLLPNIKTADVYSGGAGRGDYHLGVYEALYETLETILNDKGRMTNESVGVSVGMIPSEFSATKKTPKELKKFAEDFREASQIKNLKEAMDSLNLSSGFFGDLAVKMSLGKHVDTKPIAKFMQNYYGNQTLGETKGLNVIVTDSYNGEKILLNSKTAPNETIWKTFLKTAAIPFAFPPVVDKEGIFVDGCLTEPWPIQSALEECGADLVFGTCLSFHISKQEYRDEGVRSEVKQIMRDFDIMQNVLIARTIKYIFGKTHPPKEMIKMGDSSGRVIPMVPDLSKYPWEDFHTYAEELIGRGYKETKEVLGKFLDPKFKHPDYNSNIFSAYKSL